MVGKENRPLEIKAFPVLPEVADPVPNQNGQSKVLWEKRGAVATAGLMDSTISMQPAAAGAAVLEEGPTTETEDSSAPAVTTSKNPKVVFVLGGPGSGKGTQCSKIVDSFGFVHLSAGDLLRAEIKSGSENGTMIENMIKEGKIVPSEVTVKLLQKTMEESSKDKFLIDGFPRNEENRGAFELVTGITPEFILFLDCPEVEMEKRLLGRNQGRDDDNIETIRKRFKVFLESSLPVVQHYDSLGKVYKIDATQSIDDAFASIQPLFKPYIQKEEVPRAVEELHEELSRVILKHVKKSAIFN